MIREALPGDQAAVRALWKEAFGDSEEYMDLWFGEYYPQAKTLISVSGDTLMGALQMLPVTLVLNDVAHRGYYVGGVSVKKESRHQKIGSALMEEAARVAQGDGMDFCFLIADVVGYYERFGYQPLAYRAAFSAIPTGEAVSYQKVEEKEEDAAFAVYQAFTAKASGYLLRQKEQMIQAARLLRASAGDSVLILEGEEPVALVSYDAFGDTLYADEILWKNEKGKRLAIAFLHEFGKQKIVVRYGDAPGLARANPSAMILSFTEFPIPRDGYYNFLG